MPAKINTDKHAGFGFHIYAAFLVHWQENS